MIRIAYITIISFLVGCSNDTPAPIVVWSCNCEQQKAAAEWVGSHIADANNQSDEEMEDVIDQLQKTAIQLHCIKKMFNLRIDAAGKIREVPLDSCLVLFQY